MALHFHQPVGNFDDVIERACDRCYIPFMETLKQYPDIRMTFHFAGCLLEWIEDKRPEMTGMIRAMVDSGRIEMMSGGFYEPIIPSIPARDGLAQISMLSEYVRAHFLCEPKGAWVAERVWEPGLSSVLHDAGIKYVILDDAHFLRAGVKKDRTYGYYLTGDNGKSVAMFPSDKMLRYSMPFKMPHESVNYMKNAAKIKDNLTFIYGDDGEKFGEWPGTNKWVYEEGWLKGFFDELMKNRNWLNTMMFSECLEKKEPLGKVSLPAGSYEEMREWAGGPWRNFLVKYPEAGRMNKRMLYVSNKVDALRRKKLEKGVLDAAEKNLFKAQCNCAYWHGVFGGLYLFHLRRAVYHHLIKSETIMDKATYGRKTFCNAEVLDPDKDSLDEIVLENRGLSVYISPASGGILKELDSKAVCHNLVNVLSRRKEPYHERMIRKIEKGESKELRDCKTIHDAIQVVDAGIKDHLVYDRYERYSLIDHFLGDDVSIDAFSRCSYTEAGDFIRGRYDFEIKKSVRGVTLIMRRKGVVNTSCVNVIKKVHLPKKSALVTVDYSIENQGTDPVNVMFGPEFNLTMLGGDSGKCGIGFNGEDRGNNLNETLDRDGVSAIKLYDTDNHVSCEITFSEPCRLWHFPVKTVSQSETAYELNYQSSAVLPAWRLNLPAGKAKSLTLYKTVSKNKAKPGLKTKLNLV